MGVDYYNSTRSLSVNRGVGDNDLKKADETLVEDEADEVVLDALTTSFAPHLGDMATKLIADYDGGPPAGELAAVIQAMNPDEYETIRPRWGRRRSERAEEVASEFRNWTSECTWPTYQFRENMPAFRQN
ncbi:hypothetical protein OsI_09899 [Oryza sativa Indica Group]|uniref:Uncharacterized protein n=1 Tax=Oryza sativa subsp. indica TaxID=39946 RepID=B8AMW8_ORYSI|nr:hypothetical protein OsI_09899 [Oryza sativa Indica Group]